VRRDPTRFLKTSKHSLDEYKTDNVRVNVTLRRVLAITVAVEKQ